MPSCFSSSECEPSSRRRPWWTTSLLADVDPLVRGTAIVGPRRVARLASVELLRKVLAGNKLASPPAPETEGKLRYAVFSLVDLGDLPRMREIAASWDEAERVDFEKALARRRERPGGK